MSSRRVICVCVVLWYQFYFLLYEFVKAYNEFIERCIQIQMFSCGWSICYILTKEWIRILMGFKPEKCKWWRLLLTWLKVLVMTATDSLCLNLKNWASWSAEELTLVAEIWKWTVIHKNANYRPKTLDWNPFQVMSKISL